LGNAEEWLSAGSEALAARVATPPACARVRLTYAKRGRARFISHLELIDVFDRACRRAGLPLAFSQGHRPAPRLRFSPGLPVGAESDCEMLDIDLSEALPPAEVGARFGAHLPDGLRIIGAEELSLRAPSPEHDLIGFRYRVDVGELCNGDAGAWIDARFADFNGRSEFPMRKRTGNGEKVIDARLYVDRLERVTPAIVELDVRFTASGSVKPTDLLAAVLGLDPQAARSLPLHKTHTFYRSAATPAATLDAVALGV
jgi:radical SAM-linked protein